VPSISVKAKKKQNSLQRFLGEDTPLLGREQGAVSNYIQAEWLTVSFDENDEREEHGMLYLFPVDDHKFCLELCFLQFDEAIENQALVCALTFSPSFFDQYPAETLMVNQPFRLTKRRNSNFPSVLRPVLC